MTIKKADYMKRYVGNVDSRRTATYKSKGVDLKKYSVVATAYPGLKKLVRKQPYRDTTGYIANGNVHAAKTRGDSRTKSTQSWEK